MPFNFIQQMFYVAKAKRQLQMFYVAKAKRQLQKRPVGTELTPRYSEEPSYSCQFHG